MIGKRRLDLRVPELLERAGPERFLRGLRPELRDSLGVLAPQVAVDGQELGDVIAVRFQVRRPLENRGHDAADEAVVQLDAAPPERLREDAVVEVGAGGVPGFVSREDVHRRLQLLIVQQGKERDVQRGVGDRLPRQCSRAGRRITRVFDIPDANAGRDVRRVDAVHDELRAAVIHVVVRRDDRRARRLEPDGDVAGRRRLHGPDAVHDRPRSGHDDAGGSGLQTGHARFVERALDAEAVGPVLRERRFGAAESRNDRPFLLLLDRDFQP